jgi:hypothetical protein
MKHSLTFPIEQQSRWARFAPVLLWLAVALAGGIIVAVIWFGIVWSEADAKRQAKAGSEQARIRLAGLSVQAGEFLARMQREKPNAQLFKISLPEGLELPPASSEVEIRRLTFPVASPDARKCSMAVDAFGDVASESISMRPVALTCGGVAHPLRGEIRELTGRIVAAQVIVKKGWLSVRVSLRLPPGTTVQAWIDPVVFDVP